MEGIFVVLLALALVPPLLVGWLLRWFWRLSKADNSTGKTHFMQWLGLFSLAGISCLVFFGWLALLTWPQGSYRSSYGPSFWNKEDHFFHLLSALSVLGSLVALLLLYSRRWPVAACFEAGVLLTASVGTGWWHTTYHQQREQLLAEARVKTTLREYERTGWQTAVVDSFEQRQRNGSLETTNWIQRSPRFPGGEAALRQAIQQRIRYPAAENKIAGVVSVQFIVEADGRVTLANVTRGLDTDYDQEAVRVVASLPRFIPARQDGKPVAVIWAASVSFER